MKKVILLAIAATLSLSVFAQSKGKPTVTTISDSALKARMMEKAADTMGIYFNGKTFAQIVPKSDTLVVKEVKFLKVGDKIFSVADLANPGTIALTVPIQWIVANYQYLDNSSGGLSKKQVEELQQPLAQYYQYYMYIVQQRQQQQSPPKQ